MEILIQRLTDALIDWGLVILIAALVMGGFFRLIKGIGMRIVQALEKPSGALSQQAQSLDRLTNAIHAYIERDLSEHREIIILQKIIIEKIERLHADRRNI